MVTTYTYFKNSNTGELIYRQRFTETLISAMPDYFYDSERKLIETNVDLTGFVVMSEKKWKKEAKWNNKNKLDHDE